MATDRSNLDATDLEMLVRQLTDRLVLPRAAQVVTELHQLSARLWAEPPSGGRETYTTIVSAGEAGAMLALVESHAMQVRPASAVELAGQHDYDADNRPRVDAAAVLVTGLLALGVDNRLDEDPGPLLDGLFHIAFAGDDLTRVVRDTILSGVGHSWPPVPGLDGLPVVPFGEDCLLEMRQAARGLGGLVAGSRVTERGIPTADADGITSLSPTGGGSREAVTIFGSFPASQPAGRRILFPKAGGGTLSAEVVNWTAAPGTARASQIDVLAPDPVGDGAVGFLTHPAETGAGSYDPGAAIGFADAVAGCLGQAAAGVAGRLSHIAPGDVTLQAPPIPVLPGDVNVFHGGPVLAWVARSFGAETDPPITVTGMNLRQGDRVVIDTTPALTTFVNTSTLTFRVPAIAAGVWYLSIRRGYHDSNGTAFDVRASLDPTPPGGRFTPGTPAGLRGTGFGPTITGTLDGTVVPVAVFDTHNVEVRVRRPARDPLPADKRGEPVAVELFDRGRSLGTVAVVVDTLRIASFGDSVMWGQGLLESDKFTSLIATVVSNRRNGTIAVYTLDRFSHSGATIQPPLPTDPADPATPHPPPDVSSPGDPGWIGECPAPSPSVKLQVQQWITRSNLNQELTEIDLVIVNGGANDVGLAAGLFNPLALLDPFQSDGPLVMATINACGTTMSELLSIVLSTFPRAAVVVTGYYQIVSGESDLDLLIPALGALGLLAGLVTPLVPGAVPIGLGPYGSWALKTWVRQRLDTRCALFASSANLALQTAVSTAATAFGPRVALAVPAFGPSNAIFASDPFVWGVGLSTGGLVPLDPVAAPRAATCGTGSVTTTVASIGHPNPKGAQAYASAIEAALARLGF